MCGRFLLGDTFAMYVRRQNCAVMIHVPANEMVSVDETKNVIVSTFPGNLHPREIYQHSGDIEVISPKFCRINKKQQKNSWHKYIFDLMQSFNLSVPLPSPSSQSEIFVNVTVRRFCQSTMFSE